MCYKVKKLEKILFILNILSFVVKICNVLPILYKGVVSMSNVLAKLFGVKNEVVGPQYYEEGCDYDSYCGTSRRTLLRHYGNGRFVAVGCC